MKVIENPNIKSSSKIIEDFEKLLDLAEESSKEIDSLLQVREKQRIRSLSILSIGYAFSIFTYFTINYLIPNLDKELYSLVFIAILISISFFFLYKNFFITKKISRELHIERDIHETLISMLDIQKQRLYETDEISSVSYAIYEIRLKRLDRTDRKIY
ncbi:hypothetical protein GQQ23_12700 [Pantoea agglomerans]|uniref:hypothetical protein n=1 Tax=Enterobacter agglomerans TaxID=549 RepID=UPI0013C8231A|nr:hypothetical protein [Pantoea agglomerans]NEG63190.1 hypothetical protein [Pantoea agglomerans]